MLSLSLGEIADFDGEKVLLTGEGATGHAIASQNDNQRPGVYQVDFKIELLDADADAGDDAEPCVRLDVTAAMGAAILAQRDLTRGDLRGGSEHALVFTLRGYRALEYRLAVAGTASLRLREPVVTRMSDVIEPAAPIDPHQDTSDPVELGEQVRAVLRKLEPHALLGIAKARYGHAGDGGYICPDDFSGIDTALSFGINDDISWDLAVVDKGLTIYQFDHTVEDPAPADPRMIFEKKMIDVAAGPGSESLSSLVARHDKRAVQPNIILKTDIEGAEWPMLQATPDAELGRIAWIVGEFHYFQGLTQTEFRRLMDECLGKLARQFAVVHVHANVAGGIINIGNVVIPCVLELTFVNRACYALGPNDELFPGPLDVCCDPLQPDMYLGSFRF